jgi:hypothetical protein
MSGICEDYDPVATRRRHVGYLMRTEAASLG